MVICPQPGMIFSAREIVRGDSNNQYWHCDQGCNEGDNRRGGQPPQNRLVALNPFNHAGGLAMARPDVEQGKRAAAGQNPSAVRPARPPRQTRRPIMTSTPARPIAISLVPNRNEGKQPDFVLHRFLIASPRRPGPRRSKTPGSGSRPDMTRGDRCRLVF